MTTPRRLLVLVAFAFWQGGFTFYSAVVVPIASDHLGGPREQGFITRKVTVALNLAGACALPLFLWDVLAQPDGSRRRRLARLACWLGLATTLVWLYLLHPRLEALLDLDHEWVLDRSLFRSLHRQYLWVSTIQWGFGLVFLLASLLAWRASETPTSRDA